MATTSTLTPIIPVPAGIDPPDFRALTAHVAKSDWASGADRHTQRLSTWTYRLGTGETAFFVCRLDGPSGKKNYLPISWCRDEITGTDGWHLKGPSHPRPLLNLDELAMSPESPVVVAEGEKAALAARAYIPPTWCVTTSPFGALGAGKADWSPLAGRKVVIWPDADGPGATYAQAVFLEAQRVGATEVRVVDLPVGLPDGWDLADALPEGLVEGQVRDLLVGGQPDQGPMSSVEKSDGDVLQGVESHGESALGVGANADWDFHPNYGPYSTDDAGIWFEDLAAKVPARIWLAAPIDVLALTRDAGNSKWGILLQWRDWDGNLHREVIAREVACVDWQETVRILSNGGLRITGNYGHLKLIAAYLSGVTVPHRARVVDRIGWHSGSFVLPDEVISSQATVEHFVLAKPITDTKFKTSGTLREWQEHVAKPVEGCSRPVFVISCAFAASMLSAMGVESGGFQLFGDSSRGKTTCANVGGSVWGGPIYRETWRATSNGLELVARSHNDALLVLDEQGQALSAEVGESAYLLTSGLAKIRGNKNMELGDRVHGRILLVSTGEVRLADKIREAGRIPRTGHDVRLADIPATPEGCDQVFENHDGFPSSGDLAKHLAAACRKYYGTAARSFIRCLTAAEPELMDKVRGGVKAWVAKQVPEGSDTQVERVADRFGLVAMAGELAIRFGVLPWARGTAYWAAEACFLSWLNHRGNNEGGEAHQGIQAIVDFIDSHGTSRFADIKSPLDRVQNRTGFHRIHDDGSVDFLFSSAGWKEVCTGLDPGAVARACHEAGLLKGAMEGNQMRYAVNVKVGGATERLYVISAAGLEAWRHR
jgi:uncharacterized protein (DUF927 family)